MYKLPWWISRPLGVGSAVELGLHAGNYATRERDTHAYPPNTGTVARQRLITNAMDERFKQNESGPEPDWMTSWAAVKRRIGENAGSIKNAMQAANEAAERRRTGGSLAGSAAPMPPVPTPEATSVQPKNVFGPAPAAAAPAAMPQSPEVETVTADQFNRIDAQAPPEPPAPMAPPPMKEEIAPPPTVESPHGSVTLPPPPWRRNEAPPAAAPAAPAPLGNAPGQIPWWIRNGMMQRDNETGQFLDPQMAMRAMRGSLG